MLPPDALWLDLELLACMVFRGERGRYLAPESWLIPIIRYTASRLKSLGFKTGDEFIALFASVPAAHVTGLSPSTST